MTSRRSLSQKSHSYVDLQHNPSFSRSKSDQNKPVASTNGVRPGRRQSDGKSVLSMRQLKLISVVADTVFILLGIAAGAVVYSVVAGRPLSDSLPYLFMSTPIYLIAFVQQGLYLARHLTRRIDEIRRLSNAAVIGGFGSGGLVFAGQHSASRLAVITTAIGVFVAVALERELVRKGLTLLRERRRVVRRVIVVGDNEEAFELAKMLQTNPSLGYEVIGYSFDGHSTQGVATDENGQPILRRETDVWAASVSEFAPYVGPTDDLLDIVNEMNASGVVVATTSIDLEAANQLIRDLTREGFWVEMSSSMRDIATRRVTVRPLGRYPIMSIEPVSRRGWRAVCKRIFDVTMASLILLAVSPILIAAMIAIRVTSGSGVIFRQDRVGKHGELFTVYKLRTMVKDAESMLSELQDQNEADGPLFKMTNDPRITRVGGFLRKSSIDELPQLWNVIKGDMSLVGPRPALPHEAEQWNDELRERLRVQPGITGNWQVSGRFTTSFEDYQRLDLYYVDNWSFVTDMVILAKTLPAILKRNGAA